MKCSTCFPFSEMKFKVSKRVAELERAEGQRSSMFEQKMISEKGAFVQFKSCGMIQLYHSSKS